MRSDLESMTIKELRAYVVLSGLVLKKGMIGKIIRRDNMREFSNLPSRSGRRPGSGRSSTAESHGHQFATGKPLVDERRRPIG
jgi:hypothetical protein